MIALLDASIEGVEVNMQDRSCLFLHAISNFSIFSIVYHIDQKGNYGLCDWLFFAGTVRKFRRIDRRIGAHCVVSAEVTNEGRDFNLKVGMKKPSQDLYFALPGSFSVAHFDL